MRPGPRSHAAAPTERTVDDLATPTAENRPITDPFLRLSVARDQVNQGAAVVLAARGVADELGVPDDRRVHLHGHADLVEISKAHEPAGTPEAQRDGAADAGGAAGHENRLALRHVKLSPRRSRARLPPRGSA